MCEKIEKCQYCSNILLEGQYQNIYGTYGPHICLQICVKCGKFHKWVSKPQNANRKRYKKAKEVVNVCAT